MSAKGGAYPLSKKQAQKERTWLGYLVKMGQMVRIVVNMFSAKTDFYSSNFVILLLYIMP